MHLISGGLGSWLASKLHIADHPNEEHIFSFTDVLYEDADCYRFLIQGIGNLLDREITWVPMAEDFPDYRVSESTPIEAYAGNPDWRRFLAELRDETAYLPGFNWLVEGRDPWEVYRDERFLGNSSVDPCSKKGKREIRDRWLKANFEPSDTTIVVGIGEHERHRFDDGEGHEFGPRMEAGGWTAVAPLIGFAYAGTDPAVYARREGLRVPRLYELGYTHNNCGGFCCKAGQAHWQNRRRVQPERFAYDRMMERKMRAYLGADVSMLTDRSGDGAKKPLTLDAFDVRLKSEPQLQFQWLPGDSGCGCAIDEAEPA